MRVWGRGTALEFKTKLGSVHNHKGYQNCKLFYLVYLPFAKMIKIGDIINRFLDSIINYV